MRSIFTLLFIASFLGADFAVAGNDIPSNIDLGPTINMSEPPFWMSSYDEFNDLQDSQKEFYLEKLLVQLPHVPSLQGTTKAQLQEAAEWHQGWGSIRKKLYEYCLDKSVVSTCEGIADIRLQAIDLHSNQKLENRKADSKAAEKASAAKIPDALKAE